MTTLADPTFSAALRATHPAAYEALEATRPEADILARAGELLIRDGWCQGGERILGRRCLLGALAVAACALADQLTPYSLHLMTREYVADVLADRYPDFDGHIDHWNDQSTTTLDDVLDVLAAARALVDGCSAAVTG